MGLKTDYVEYGMEISLSILGLSAAYFVDMANPVTLLGLLIIPVLYGYTAYISGEGFNHASLVSLTALLFTAVGGFTAVIAVVYGIGNVLVSYFSHGSHFKEFYGSTSLPILITGLVVGTSLFIYGSNNPDFQDKIAETAGEKAGRMSKTLVPASNMVEDQRKKQMEMINSTSVMAVRIASQEVMNQTGKSLELRNAFIKAEKPVKKRIYRQYTRRFEERELSISDKVKNQATNQMKRLNFVLVIPFAAGLFYSLQPILGILTGIFAVLFKLIGD